MNLSDKISSKFEAQNKSHQEHQFSIKELLTANTTESREKIFSSLRELQNSVKDTISDALLKMQKSNSEELKRMSEQSNENFKLIQETNNQKLIDIQKEIERRMDISMEGNLKSFGEVTTRLTEMKQTAQTMIDSTSTIDKLNKIFDRAASKSFGSFSENYLETILENNLKGLWKSQVAMKQGSEAIDFVIELGAITIGIDSKFPLTAFNDYQEASGTDRDAKLKEYLAMIKTMALSMNTKYGNNFDHLLMYIPSDIMYNEVVTNQSVFDKLHALKVMPVSPTTIYSVIYSINIIRDRIAINENAHKMQSSISQLSKNITAFKDDYEKLGKKIRETQTTYDTTASRVSRIDSQIEKVLRLDIVEQSLELSSNQEDLILEEVVQSNQSNNYYQS
jgi:DNA recombination protein RmuC